MATRTTFSILTKPAGFFSHGGHEESDEEVFLKAEVESYSDNEFSMQGGNGELDFNEELGGMPLFIDIQGPINDMGMSGLDIPGEIVNPGLRGELDALFEQHYEGGDDLNIFNDEESFLNLITGEIDEEIVHVGDSW
jgi:hypothetical protein